MREGCVYVWWGWSVVAIASIVALMAVGLARGDVNSCQSYYLDPAALAAMTTECQAEIAAAKRGTKVYTVEGPPLWGLNLSDWCQRDGSDVQMEGRCNSTLSFLYDWELTSSCRTEMRAALMWVTVTDTGTDCAISPCTDADSDSVCDVIDNCSAKANPTQTDTNSDGYGNACDADWDNNGIVGVQDLGLYQTHLFHPAGTDPLDAEIDCQEPPNGVVGVQDMGCWMVGFGGPPGPSGLYCARPEWPGTCPPWEGPE